MDETLRVLLLQAETSEVNRCPPLGLAYLGSALEVAGCDVRIIDAGAPYARYTLSDLVHEARAFAAHVVGVTTFVSTARTTYRLLQTLAGSKLDCLLLAGGPHATSVPGEPLRYGADVVVRGEGEMAIRELAAHARGEKPLEAIRGITYLDPEGRVVHNPPQPFFLDLDSLPVPARHLFRVTDYIRRPEDRDRFGNLFTSRGCPFGCPYCSNAVFGRRLRQHSPERVLAEIEALSEGWGVRRFHVYDDTFAVNRHWVERLCDLLIERDLGVEWECRNRVDCVDRPILERMRRAGCRKVLYGIESGHPDTLRRIERDYTPEQAAWCLQQTREAGLDSVAAFMFGFPWETADDVAVTTQFMERVEPDVWAFNPSGILVPIPGTPIYEAYREQCRLEGWWLEETGAARAQRVPLFAWAFFNWLALERGWFAYPPDVVAEIRRAGEFIGRHNLKAAARRAGAALRLPVGLLWRLLLTLCRLSEWLYRLSPRLERLLIAPFAAAARRLQGY